MGQVISYLIVIIWFKKIIQPKLMVKYKNDSQKDGSYSEKEEKELYKIANIILISLAIQVIINITIKDTILWAMLLILNMVVILIITTNSPLIKKHKWENKRKRD